MRKLLFALCVLALLARADVAAAQKIVLQVGPWEAAGAKRHEPGGRNNTEIISWSVNGNPIELAEKANRCVAFAYGYGVVIRVSDCTTTFTARVANNTSRRKRVVVRYRVR